MLSKNQIKEVKINNIKVKAILQEKEEDISKWRGSKIFNVRYPNIFLLAKKNSGKTCTIFTILKQTLTKNTEVIIFSSTVHKDKNMIHIVKYLKKKKIPVLTFTSLYEDGKNKLQEFYESLENNSSESDSSNISEEEDIAKINKYIMVDSDSEDEDVKKKKEPVYIVIFDDLSSELKEKAVPYFMKRNRHFKALCILSSQYLFDLAKDGRNQIDYILMFPALPLEKVESIQKELDLNIPKKKFYEMYEKATLEKYNFLFVDVRNGEYRKKN